MCLNLNKGRSKKIKFMRRSLEENGLRSTRKNGLRLSRSSIQRIAKHVLFYTYVLIRRDKQPNHTVTSRTISRKKPMSKRGDWSSPPLTLGLGKLWFLPLWLFRDAIVLAGKYWNIIYQKLTLKSYPSSYKYNKTYLSLVAFIVRMLNYLWNTR